MPQQLIACDACPGIFTDCCAIDGDVLGLTKPFVIAGQLYATDGRIIVRGKFAGEPLPSGSRQFPVGDVGWPDAATLERLPFVPLPAVGHGRATCPDCHGTGKCYLDDTSSVKVECENCDGAGVCDDWRPVVVGQTRLAAKYIALLRRNEIATVRIVSVAKAYKLGRRETKAVPGAAYFVGDGFEGLLMGIACKRKDGAA